MKHFKLKPKPDSAFLLEQSFGHVFKSVPNHKLRKSITNLSPKAPASFDKKQPRFDMILNASRFVHFTESAAGIMNQ